MHSLGVFNLMYEHLDGHQCVNDNQIGDSHSLIIDHNITQFNKIATILFLCKDRAINEYHDITAESYYKSKNMNIILGPYAGLEPSKVTLSAFYKFALSKYDLSEYNQYLGSFHLHEILLPQYFALTRQYRLQLHRVF